MSALNNLRTYERIDTVVTRIGWEDGDDATVQEFVELLKELSTPDGQDVARNWLRNNGHLR